MDLKKVQNGELASLGNTHPRDYYFYIRLVIKNYC